MHTNCFLILNRANMVFSYCRLGLMSHFGALAAASSRYAALCGAPTDPRTLPWYWGRIPSQLPQEKSSPNGIYK